MNIKYYKSVNINKYSTEHFTLQCGLSFGFKSVFQTLNINYIQTCEVIDRLLLFNTSIDKINDEFELSSHVSTFRFFKDKTIIYDDLWGSAEIYLDTKTILDILIEKKTFMESWTKESLFLEIHSVFKKLKEQSNTYLQSTLYSFYKVPLANSKYFFDIYNFQEHEFSNYENILSFLEIDKNYFSFLR